MFAPRNAEERSERSDEKRVIHKALDAFRHDAFGNFLSQLSDVETPLVSSPAACASLLGRIREFRDQKIECDVPEEIVERAIAFFALECCETLHRIVLRTLITTLHGLSPHLDFYRSSLDHPFRFLLSQGPISWMAMNPVSIQQRVFAEHRIASLTSSPTPSSSTSPPQASSLRRTSQRGAAPPPAPAFSTSLVFSYVRTIRFEQRAIIRERVHEIERSQEELMTRVGHLHQNHHELSKIASLDKLTLSQSVSSAHHHTAVGGGVGAGVAANATPSASPTEMSLYARGIVPPPVTLRTSEVAVDVLSPYVNYLRSVLLPKEPDTELRTVDQMLHALEDIALEIPLYHQTLRRLCATFRRPSHLQRYWPEYTVGLFCGVFLGHWVFTNWKVLESFGSRFQGAVRNFLVSQVYEPLKAIYEHVFKTITARPAVVREESLTSSKETLSRMLESFAVAEIEKKSSKLSAKEKWRRINDAKYRASEGDMSLVMPQYEADVKNPVWPLVRGDLLQNLLIQVQKEKTDLEVAMAQLNQILEINELTFRFLATIPAFLVCWPAFSLLRSAFFGSASSRGEQRRSVSREVVRLLRDIDSLLIRNSVAAGMLSVEQQAAAAAAGGGAGGITAAPAAAPSTAALSTLSRAHTLPQTPRIVRAGASTADYKAPPSKTPAAPARSVKIKAPPSRAPSPALHLPHRAAATLHRPGLRLGFKDNGGLLLDCFCLRLRARDLLRAHAVSGQSYADLVADIGLLEGCDFDVLQKRMIVARLSSMWGASLGGRR